MNESLNLQIHLCKISKYAITVANLEVLPIQNFSSA